MSPAELGVAAVVLLTTYGITAALSVPGKRFTVVDRPNQRSLHTQPTPRTGGLAILAGCGLGFVATWLLGVGVGRIAASQAPPTPNVWPWLFGATVVVGTVSLVDDLRGVSPALRLAVHGVVAASLVWGAGLVVRDVPVPLFGSLRLGPLAAGVSIGFLLWMTNLYNFMDGMDGFAGGMTVAGFGFLALIASKAEHQTLGGLGLVVTAATAGFLLHNLPPAKIFMGDAGSVPLGFLAGALSLLGVRDGVFDIWVPLLIFSPFVVDASLTLLSRMVRRERFWEAHRQHLYQRLVVSGWGHRRTVLAEYGLMLASGALACLYVLASEEWRFVLLGSSAIGYASLIVGVRRIERTHAAEQRGLS